MNKELVSVIVPIYNVEQYVENCVRSLINQDYKNIEIILVDDGSPDSSGKIIDELAKEDSRITVIHQENKGVSSARNSGLDNAKGQYVMFVDGDDYVDSDYVSFFLNMVIRSGCNIGMNYSNHTYKRSKENGNEEYKTIEWNKATEDIYLGKINVAVWNKIYNREFLTANNLKFDPHIWYGEGMLFNICCLQATDKVAVGDKNVYYQVYNVKSAMRSFNLESNYCGLKSMKMQYDMMVKKTKEIENAWRYHYFCFNQSILCGLIKTNQVNIYKDEYKKCKKNLFLEFKIPMSVNIGFKKKFIHFLIALFPVLMAKYSAKRDLQVSKKIKTKI